MGSCTELSVLFECSDWCLQFRLYIGLLSSLPIYRKVKKSKGNTDMTYEDGGDASDNDDTPKAKQVNLNIIQDPLEQIISEPVKKLETDLCPYIVHNPKKQHNSAIDDYVGL